MFTNYHILDFFNYICAQNAQCWARITKSNMEIQRYNRLKIVLAEKERTGTWGIIGIVEMKESKKNLKSRINGCKHEY